MEALHQLQQTLPPLAFEVFKLSMGLSLLIILFIPIEKFFPLRSQKTIRTGISNDLAYYYLNNLLTHRLLVIPMSMIAWGVHQVTSLPWHVWVAELPFPIRLTAALIVGEIGFYWGHRCMHEIPVLWRFHAVHHSAEQMDWLVNAHANPLDMIIIRLCGFIPMYVLGLAQPMSNQLDLTPALVTMISHIWGYFIHANIKWRFSWFEYLLATPAFHHWHHNNDGQNLINKNYAALFPWVDKLFGSFYLPKSLSPKKYGINQKMSANIIMQIFVP